MLLNSIYNLPAIDLINKIPDNFVDLYILDPPYMVTNQPWDKLDAINTELVCQLHRTLKDTGSCYCWCGIGEKSNNLLRWLPIFSEKFYFKDLITWKKQRGMGTRRGWLYTREECMWFVKDNKKFIWNDSEQYSDIKRCKQKYGYKLKNGKCCDDYIKSEYLRLTNVWTDISETTWNTSKRGLVGKHYTPKPEKAISRIIKCHTAVEDVVCDPFVGSGTTAVCAQELGRNWIVGDISSEFCKLTSERLGLFGGYVNG